MGTSSRARGGAERGGIEGFKYVHSTFRLCTRKSDGMAWHDLQVPSGSFQQETFRLIDCSAHTLALHEIKKRSSQTCRGVCVEQSPPPPIIPLAKHGSPVGHHQDLAKPHTNDNSQCTHKSKKYTRLPLSHTHSQRPVRQRHSHTCNSRSTPPDTMIGEVLCIANDVTKCPWASSNVRTHRPVCAQKVPRKKKQKEKKEGKGLL